MSIFTKPKREPDFSYLEKTLNREPTDRPVLFEFYMNDTVYDIATEGLKLPDDGNIRSAVKMMYSFRELGYDYATLLTLPGFEFKSWIWETRTISLNDDPIITDWESYEKYTWPEITETNFSFLEKIIPFIPEGMKLVAAGPGGVEENVISLVGYENLCFMMADDAKLVHAVFDNVGSRLVEYYKRICEYPCIGAVISNDDWGFKTQTLLSHDQMERYLYPWHKEITGTIHGADRMAILHSCGNIYPIMDVIIDDLQYEAKHSYEDEIKPVEEAYEEYWDKIAIFGGIDLDFVCQRTPEEVYTRSKAMIERSETRGGYAHGTGNSVPEYVPPENYFALLRAAVE